MTNSKNGMKSCWKMPSVTPSRFSHLNFKELRSSDECKQAGIPKTLDTIDGELLFFKYIHKTRH